MFRVTSLREASKEGYKWADLIVSIIDIPLPNMDNRIHIWAADSYDEYGPTIEHLLSVKSFLKGQYDKKILIHCSAGVSRSTGVLLFLLMENLNYFDAYQEMLRIRPQATPNCKIVDLCDKFYSCENKLIELDREYKGM